MKSPNPSMRQAFQGSINGRRYTPFHKLQPRPSIRYLLRWLFCDLITLLFFSDAGVVYNIKGPRSLH